MIDAGILLQGKTPQIASPLDRLARLTQLQGEQQQVQQNAAEAPLRLQAAQQSAQSGQLQLQQQQQLQKDDQTFRQASQDPSFKGKTIGEIADALASQGHISQAGLLAAKKADLEHQETVAKLDTSKLANIKAAHDQTQQIYNNVMDLPDEQVTAQWPQIAQQIKSIPGNEKIPLDPSQPMSKQQLAQYGPLLSMGNAYLDQELARREKQQQLKDQQGKTDPTSALYAPTKEAVALGTAPGAAAIQANEVTQAGAKSAAEAKAKQPFEMALARQRQALSQGDPNAAAQLLIDGDATLSELKARGATPDFIQKTLSAARQKSGGKYNAQAAEAQFQVAKSPTNVAFFGSAKSLTDPGGTLDQLAVAAKDIPGGKIPAFNSIADWEKAATGSGPIAKYATIALGVADDYAKVMGSGTGSDTSRKQALDRFGASMSPEQRAGSIQGARGTVSSQVKSRIGKNEVLERMYGDIAAPASSGGGKISVTAPDGSVHPFETQAQADAFKKLAGIK